ncbi:hypothetical protein ACFQ0B_59205 [Nonomuraea thailandensis]
MAAVARRAGVGVATLYRRFLPRVADHGGVRRRAGRVRVGRGRGAGRPGSVAGVLRGDREGVRDAGRRPGVHRRVPDGLP